MAVEVVVMGGGSDSKPIFHDFFASTSGDVSGGGGGGKGQCDMVEGSVSGSVSASTLVSVGLSSGGSRRTSDLGSERRGVNNSEVFHFHGRKSDISGPEFTNILSGRKRSFYDSTFTGVVLDRHLPAGSDSFERSSIFKMLSKDVVTERMVRSRGDGIMFPVQPPPWPNSVVSRMPSGNRPDSLISTQPVNPAGQILHRPSRFSQGGVHSKKASSSYDLGDANARSTILSPSTADEGSRTGIKGYGLNEIINPSGEAGQRNLVSILPRTKVAGDTEPGPCNAPRCPATTFATRQMTIFYGGQAHVFDDVHPNKADVIMALASSSGCSWTTTYSNKLTDLPVTGKSNIPAQEETLVSKNISDFSRLTQKQPANDCPSPRTDGKKRSLTDRDQTLVTQAAEPNSEDKREV